MTYPVFIQREKNLKELNVSDCFIVEDSEAHHAISVMRLKDNDIVDIVDGNGLRLRSSIKVLSKNSFECKILEKFLPKTSKLDLSLIQALAKGSRDEQAVESCVELGIMNVIPWKADRCVSVWVGNKIQKSINKWQNIVFSAVKQSRQAFLPNVLPMLDSKGLASFVEKKSSDKILFLVLHESAEEYLSDLDEALFEDCQHIYVIVGPEGGISDAELDTFVSKGAIKVRLSDSVLRTSNAGCVALSMLATRTKIWSKNS